MLNEQVPKNLTTKKVFWNKVLKYISRVYFIGIIFLISISAVDFYLKDKISGVRPSDISIPFIATGNDITNVSCESDEIPLIQKGENVTQKIRRDLDNDGVKELLVVYESMTPGWEGMPMPSDRLNLFSCENNNLVLSEQISPMISLGFITYESGSAVISNDPSNDNEWFLLLKKGKDYGRIYPIEERQKVLNKFGIIPSNEDRTGSPKVIDNKIVETLSEINSDKELVIVYEFKNNQLNVVSSEQLKKISINARDLKYPANLECEYTSDSKSFTGCVPNIVNGFSATYRFSGSSNAISDSIYLLSIDPTDSNCINWQKSNQYKQEGCISMEGGKNYAVYANSNTTPVISDFNALIKLNKSY